MSAATSPFAVPGDNEGSGAGGGDGLLNPLIIVDVAGQNQVGDSSGIANGIFERVGHLRASAVKNVERIDRMVERQNERSVLRRRCELVGQPLLLNGIDGAMLGDVGVDADDGRQRRDQGPIEIGKIQADARGIF